VSQIIACFSGKTPYPENKNRSRFSGQVGISVRMMRAVTEGSGKLLSYSYGPDVLRRKLTFWRIWSFVATALLTFAVLILASTGPEVWWYTFRDFIGRLFGHPLIP
jgi:hypothetical protein